MNSVFAARAKALPRYIVSRVIRRMPPPSVGRDPSNPRAWLALAMKEIDALPERSKTLMLRHELSDDSFAISFFEPKIRKTSGARLTELSKLAPTPQIISEAIDEIIKGKTIAQCAYAHRAGPYFDNAEVVMLDQWQRIIWPIIKDEDFTSTLELACGHGRNTEFLRQHASSIDLVDVNPSCIKACRNRFGERKERCEFRYHLTNGNGFPSIASNSITFGYSWDSMVHFDKLVIRDYVYEFARVLKPAGTAFLHHSNYGAFSPDSDWTKNHGSRSDMTAEMMREYAREAGLSIKFQRLSGTADCWGLDDLDCLSVLQKPSI